MHVKNTLPFLLPLNPEFSTGEHYKERSSIKRTVIVVKRQEGRSLRVYRLFYSTTCIL